MLEKEFSKKLKTLDQDQTQIIILITPSYHPENRPVVGVVVTAPPVVIVGLVKKQVVELPLDMDRKMMDTVVALAISFVVVGVSVLKDLFRLGLLLEV